MLRRAPRQFWLAVLAYALVALYLTSPIQQEMDSRFLGGDTGDAYEMARHVWWYRTALVRGEDVFQHTLLGYPEGFPAVQLWAHPLQYFPMWLFALVLPLASAYNLALLLSFALNGCAMFALARRRLPASGHAAAFVAGLVFMVFPIMQAHLFEGHAGLVAQWSLPLFIFALFEYADKGGKRRFVAAALCFALAALGNSLQLIYALGPLCLMFFLARLYRRDQVGAGRALAVAIAGCALLLLFLSPVIPDVLANAELRGAGGYLRYSIDLLGLVTPSFANPFWRDIATHAPDVLGTNLGEGASYVGLIGFSLAFMGALYRRAARWWLLTACLAWLLALGPVLKIYDQALTANIAGYEAVLPLPYALFINLPVFELARTPGRFMFLFAAMFAMAAGYGMTVFWGSPVIRRRRRLTRLIIVGLLAFIIVEDYKLFATFPSLPADLPREIRSLSRRRDIRAVYNAPYDHLLAAKEAMYLQTAHEKPLIAGHDARATSVDRARLALLSTFSPSLLAEASADLVIINKARAAEMGQLDLLQGRARQALGAPFYEDQRFLVYETPISRGLPAVVYSTATEAESHATYIYKAQPGWLALDATLEAVDRRAHLWLNDTPLETLVVQGKIPISIPLPIARRGYHTFRIEQDPPCPQQRDAALLVCQTVAVAEVRVRSLSDGAIYDPIRIADGIVLAGFLLPSQPEGDLLQIRLWWRFEADRSARDVRFVHVLDERGQPVAQQPPDNSFGAIAAGSELTETVDLDAGALEPGEYRVLTGWYALPQAIRYDVLSSVDGAQDDTVVLGAFRLRA